MSALFCDITVTFGCTLVTGGSVKVRGTIIPAFAVVPVIDCIPLLSHVPGANTVFVYIESPPLSPESCCVWVQVVSAAAHTLVYSPNPVTHHDISAVVEFVVVTLPVFTVISVPVSELPLWIVVTG